MNQDSAPGRASSAAYRTCTEAKMNDLFEQIRIYSASNDISIEEAKKQLLERGQVDKWEIIPLEGKDAQVGDTFTSEHPPQVVCISRIIGERTYIDTVLVTVTDFEDGQKNFEIVTYMQRETNLVTHSGDKIVDYGLLHSICFKQSNQPMKAYVVSTPWKDRKSLPVKEVKHSNSILEIRTENETENNTELKRTVIPQDYDGTTDEQTACVNAKVSYDGELWTVTIERKPIKGFASDPDKLIEEIKKLENN